MVSISDISTQNIIKDIRLNSIILNSFLFFMVGFSVSVSPIIYLHNFSLNLFIGTIFCFICFGIPFGYLFGIKRFVRAIRIKNALNSGNYEIFVDTVVSMRMLGEGLSDLDSDRYCQIKFRKYSAVTGEYYSVTRHLYEKTNECDSFYMFYFDDIKNTFAIYPTKCTKLNDELSAKINQCV